MPGAQLLKAKLKAALLHISLSGVIFVPLAYMIFFRWFPGPLFFTDGGWQGVRIMLLVDMVLGPSLTFMVYNPAKTRLALGVDFGFIGVVQAVALAYGIWNIESTRIWSIAYNPLFESFMAVGKDRFAVQEIPENGWVRLGAEPQYWVFVRDFKSDERPLMQLAESQGVPLEAIYPLYEPLADHKKDIFPKELQMPKLAALDAQFARDYQDFLQAHGGGKQELHFYRLIGFYSSVVIALDADAKNVGFINRDIPK